MTEEAWEALVEELGRLRADVAVRAGSNAHGHGVVDLSTVKAARRLDVLAAVSHASERIQESGHAVIGRRVTLLEPDGVSVSYTLAFPGDGDLEQGRVSADSPLGTAVLRSRPGDRVEVRAPAGHRVVTVLSVE
jgi:transcription elongation GreA/GreB family factor